jgi:hypothetical protein
MKIFSGKKLNSSQVVDYEMTDSNNFAVLSAVQILCSTNTCACVLLG